MLLNGVGIGRSTRRLRRRPEPAQARALHARRPPADPPVRGAARGAAGLPAAARLELPRRDRAAAGGVPAAAAGGSSCRCRSRRSCDGRAAPRAARRARGLLRGRARTGTQLPARRDARGGARVPDRRVAARALPRLRLRHEHGLRPVRPGLLGRYEETQAFSPRFVDVHAGSWPSAGSSATTCAAGACSRSAAARASSCSRCTSSGSAEGSGSTPAFVPERADERPGQVEWIRDLYSERYAQLPADAVVCRHTLEHIQPVARVHAARCARALAGGEAGAVRAPRRAARTPRGRLLGPLLRARVVLLAGLAGAALPLDRVRRAGARARLRRPVHPARARGPDGAGGAPLPLEEPPEEVALAVETFRRAYDAQVARWREELGAARTRPRDLGRRLEGRLVPDDARRRRGDRARGRRQPVQAGTVAGRLGRATWSRPAALREHRPDLVVAMNPIYLDEIGGSSAELGVEAQAGRGHSRAVRIAFLTQPWARALPPSESVAIWTQAVATRLAPPGTTWHLVARTRRPGRHRSAATASSTASCAHAATTGSSSHSGASTFRPPTPTVRDVFVPRIYHAACCESSGATRPTSSTSRRSPSSSGRSADLPRSRRASTSGTR